MAGSTDETKGKIKEAAGDLTGNDDLKHEGKADKAGGKIKDAVDTVKDKLTGNDEIGLAPVRERQRATC